MRIMIVDDSAAFREAIWHLLDKNPVCEVVAEAENGMLAIEKYESAKPDIILMDIEMPVLNGIEATKQILKTDSRIKIIAVTAYLEKIYLNELLGIGFVAYVNKNNVSDQLEAAINSAAIVKSTYIKNIINK